MIQVNNLGMFGEYKWRLGSPHHYTTCLKGCLIRTPFVCLLPDGELIIEPGYCWDGASGPTWDTPSCRRGALIHDALYQLLRSKKLPMAHKPYIDGLLRTICMEDGMSEWRANLWYIGVKIFGAGALSSRY